MASGAFVVDVRQRHGELETTLPELQGDVRLFVLGRRLNDNGTADVLWVPGGAR